MIIFRYLSREALTTLIGVALALLVIIVAGRFGKYLGVAASGEMASGVVLSLIYFRLPGFLELILPLAFFLAILLAHGRMYVDSEMAVLSACGVSPGRVLAWTLVPATLVAALVAGLTLWVTPQATARFEQIWNDPKYFSGLNTLVAGRFQQQDGGMGARVSYSEALSEDRTVMERVFIVDQRGGGPRGLSVLVAERANLIEDAQGRRYLEFHNGRRYEGQPGQPSLRVTEFSSFAQLVREGKAIDAGVEVEAMPTSALVGAVKPEQRAALHWRLALPVLLPVVAVLAAAMARTNPRQGRYSRMLPAIILYLLYIVALNAGRNAVGDGKLSPLAGIWLVHALFALIAAGLWNWPALSARFARRRVAA